MSADARRWKKDLLREKGAEVVEYPDDYSTVIARVRDEATGPFRFFVDDENSQELFMGYAVAARRLQRQLAGMGIAVSEARPLFLHLPCGVGGAPGGITFGAKSIYGDNAHCFFDEPVNSCCMLLGMASGLHDRISVRDFGLSGKTEADGLAVGRPSKFVGRAMEPLCSGVLTCRDDRLYQWMAALHGLEGIFVEPSSCASFAFTLHGALMDEYCRRAGMDGAARDGAAHILWATGGGMVPAEVRAEMLKKP
jgi:D-serine dehydratase